jgi:uncharacterized SAM-dependent methyltransferase
MFYTNAPVSTLYAKATLKRSPYSNTPVAVRVVADIFPTFVANKAQYFVDLHVDASMQDVELVLANLQLKANARRVALVMNPALGVLLIGRNKTVA